MSQSVLGAPVSRRTGTYRYPAATLCGYRHWIRPRNRCGAGRNRTVHVGHCCLFRSLWSRKPPWCCRRSTRDDLQVVKSKQIQVEPINRWLVHVAELIGIFYAISIVFVLAHQGLANRQKQRRFCATVDQPYRQLRTQGTNLDSGWIYVILQEVEAAGIALRLQWVPGYCDNPGNDAVDRLAKDAACPGKTHPFRPLLSRESARIQGNILEQWEQEWRSSNKGGHLQKSDRTLPANHTRRPYGSLPKNRAYLLAQLRRGNNWLSACAKTFGFT